MNNRQRCRTVSERAAALSRLDLDALDYASLRAHIEQIVALVEEPLTLSNTLFRWHRVADPDALLTEAVVLSDERATDVDPFWSVAWRAAEGLAAYLLRLSLGGVRVLELGAGAGQAGLSAAACGAHVTLSDAVDMALLVARLNSWPVRERVRIRRLRWEEPRLEDAPFPIILGSDLVYDPAHFPQLEDCARRHLAEGGRWLLSEPNRHSGDHFAKWIVERGWQCAEHQLDMGDGRIAIRIFDCSLPSG